MSVPLTTKLPVTVVLPNNSVVVATARVSVVTTSLIVAVFATTSMANTTEASMSSLTVKKFSTDRLPAMIKLLLSGLIIDDIK